MWDSTDILGHGIAMRQLTKKPWKRGRRQTALPGGKLKPLFKNHAAIQQREKGCLSGKQVLPSIQNVSLESPGLAVQHVMAGRTENLPPFPPTSVRVYLCSDFADMAAEREALWQKAVPRLREFCSQHGLLFQLVDLHVGLEEAAQVLPEVPVHEIKKCQRLSLGPNFVALLGETFGRPKPPLSLSESEYEALYTVAMENNLNHSEILARSYFRDTNAEPTSFILQNVSDEEKDQLVTLISAACDLAAEDKNLPHKSMLCASAIEKEVSAGLFQAREPRAHGLCFHREYKSPEDLPASRHSSATSAVFKKIGSKDSALIKRVKQYLGENNCKDYYMPEERSDEEQQTYLDRLCQDFVKALQEKIQEGMELQQQQWKGSFTVKELYKEVLHHAYIADSSRTAFTGQSETLNKIQRYLSDPRQNTRPLLLHGESSQGKTAVMTALTSRLLEWFGDSAVVVYRCLGTSSGSCHIRNVVKNMVLQICHTYKLKPPRDELASDVLYKVLTAFRNTVDMVSRTQGSSRPLFLLLDGIDKLQPLEASFRALWAVQEFPPNVHLVLSTKPTFGQVKFVDAFASMMGDFNSMLALDPLTKQDQEEIARKHLQMEKRTLTTEQMAELLKTYEGNPEPFTLELLSNEAVIWGSYQKEHQFLVDYKQPVNSLTELLEMKCGSDAIKYLLSYITLVSTTGIHEQELLDLLTLKQEVSVEVSKGKAWSQIFPQSVLSDVLYILSGCMCSGLYHGKQTIAWRHSKILTAVAQKYGIIYPGVDEDCITDSATNYTLSLHEDVVHLYANKNIESGTSLHVSPQPITKLNLAKLSRIVHHSKILLPLKGLQDIKADVFFNAAWLFAKSRAGLGHQMLEEMYSVLVLARHLAESDVLDEEFTDIQDLFQFFISCKSALSDPDVFPILAYEKLVLSGLTKQHGAMAGLEEGLTKWVQETTSPTIIPMFAPVNHPVENVLDSINSSSHVVYVSNTSPLAVFFNQSTGVTLYDADMMEVLHVIPTAKEQSVENILASHSGEFLLITHYHHTDHLTRLAVWNLNTGLQVLTTQFSYQFEAVTLSPDDKMLAVVTKVDKQRCLLIVNVTSKEIIQTLPVTDIHKDGIAKLQFVKTSDPDDLQLITVGTKRSKDIALWDLTSESLLHQLNVDDSVNLIERASESDFIVVVSQSGGKVMKMNCQTLEVMKVYSDDTFKTVKDLSIKSDGQSVYLASGNGVIELNLETGNLDTLAATASIPMQKILLDEDNSVLYVGSTNGSLYVMSKPDNQIVNQMEMFNGAVTSLVFCPNSNFMSCAGADGSVKKVNLKTLSASEEDDQNVKLLAKEQNVAHLLWLSSSMVLTVTKDAAMKTWDPPTGEVKHTLAPQDQGTTLSSAYVTYKGKLLISQCSSPGSSSQQELRMYNVDSGHQVASLDCVYTSTALPGGDKLLIVKPGEGRGTSDLHFSLYDLFDTTLRDCEESLKVYNYTADWTNLQVIIPDEVPQPSAYEDDVQQCLLLLHQPEEAVSYFYTVVARYENGSCQHVDVPRQNPVHLDSLGAGCTVILDGERAVTGGVDGSLVVWNMTNQEMLHVLADYQLPAGEKSGGLTESHAHQGAIRAVNKSKSGQIITAGADGWVKVWDPQEVKLLKSILLPHAQDDLSTIRLFSNERLLLVAVGSTVKVVDLSNSKQLCSYPARGVITDLQISPDDKYISVVLSKTNRAVMFKVKNMP